MLSDKARAKSQRVVGGLLLSSAVAMLAACGGAPVDPGNTTSSTPNTTSSSNNSQPNNSSSPTTSSTGTTSSSGTNSSATSSNGSNSSSPIFTDDTPGIFRVNPQGKITKNNQVMPVRCANWFGLEGQHEEDGGAPLELYIGNMWWTDSTRTIDDAIEDMKTLGINMIRLPIAPETLIPNHPDGVGWRDPDAGGNESNPLKNKKNVYDFPDARSAMEAVIGKLGDADIAVMVDIHSCSSYVGWRAGSLNAAPPYADKDRGPDYVFTREDYSCGVGGATNVVPTSSGYSEAQWLDDIRDIANMAKTHTNIIGVDIFNEPWEYSWDEWATLSEKAYAVIEETNDNLLIFVQGVATEKDTPHGDETTNPNWGENFYAFNERPLNIPQNRLVISPHTYGPAVYQQMQFMDLGKDPSCEGLHGEEAAEHKCDMKLEASRLVPGWEEHFGFLRDMGYATIIGEFGGNRHWPVGGGARDSETEAWGHLTGAVTGENNIDWQWQKIFVNYMKEHEIEGCYWGFNPESSDTGGLYNHGYDNDEGAWGTWEGFDETKVNLLKDLWGM